MNSVVHRVEDASYTAVWRVPAPGPSLLVGIRVAGGKLCSLDYLPEVPVEDLPQHPLAEEVIRQLKAYFLNPTRRFNLPLNLPGTPFQRRVWRHVQSITAGATLSYGDLARRLKTSPRAIGGACRANPIPIIVPCHRVVARSGLGGYGGATSGARMQIKESLLAHERKVSSERVSIAG